MFNFNQHNVTTQGSGNYSREDSSISHNGNEISTTVSIGIIEITPPDDIKGSEVHMERYIEAADGKLYLAKHSGKNCLK
ncbi:MAG: hypothetical protein U9Q62_05030 [Campylobacterota bacterium]|nr:hypothetical protein [Campylobacterota bacterium]